MVSSPCKQGEMIFFFALIHRTASFLMLKLLCCDVLIREANESLHFKCSNTVVYASVGAKNKQASE